MDKGIWYFENVNLTNFFCPRKLGGHMDDTAAKDYKRNEYIYLPEESSNKIYLIVSGQVKIGAYGENGKEITKAILSAGEVFGELALIDQGKRRDFALALKETCLYIVNSDYMTTLLKDHSQLNLMIMRLLGSRVLKMEQRLESMVFKDSRTRIIEFLIELVNTKGSPVGYEHVVRGFLTHQEIANLTATSRQTVTTILNQLRKDEILTFDRRRLLVRDLEKLQQEAERIES